MGSLSNYLQTLAWNNEPEAIWLGSSLILRRNLAGYNFPGKLSIPEKEQVLEKIKNGLKAMESPHFFQQKDLSSQDRELLYEHFLFLRGFEDPPDGSGLGLEEKGNLIALFNMGDHLQVRAISPTNRWDGSWKRMNDVLDQMGLDFSFSPKFGYLTSDVSECGTGLTVYAYLHLPALIHGNQLQSALAQNEDVEFMGLSGDLSELIGDVVIVQNHFSIGESEEAILHAVQTAATKLIGAEKTMRGHLKEKPSSEIKDMISKGFGLLVHSYQLETKEALDLLSLMRLGLVLGEIRNVSDQKLSELAFLCRRGHLLQKFPDLKDPESIAKKRASFVQQELSGISLTSETA